MQKNEIRKMWNVSKYDTKYELVKVPNEIPMNIISSIMVILQLKHGNKVFSKLIVYTLVI